MQGLRQIVIFILFLYNILSSENTFSQEIRNTPDTVTVYTYKLKGKTATGQLTSKIKEPFLAISRDLIKNYPLSSKVILYDCSWEGTYKIMDIMGGGHIKSVDIYYTGKKKTTKKKCLCTLAFE
ncbi:MAG: hypothetical protein IPK35_14995 [Saprospiraceae bacterium]|jgi:3D (Asp-Asp-Asp) domain-containing protein|nr:hypothetical protein [Saprospiraceae bacterium]